MVKKETVAAIVRADKEKIISLQRKIMQMDKELHRKEQRIEELEIQVRRVLAIANTIPTELMC